MIAQLLECPRCGDADLVDLGAPVDLCRRCRRELVGTARWTDEALYVLQNADVLVEQDGLTWEAAVARMRRKGDR